MTEVQRTTAVHQRSRRIGLFGATGIGVGAIVGGGILALAGTAFATTGASAVLAFALNGVIAIITALSFAELSSAFPQSGGTYVFAKRVLGVGAAFNVGWVVWFASIVAATLYAIGFAAFACGIVACWAPAPVAAWATGPGCLALVAAVSTLLITWRLSRVSGSGGNAVNVLKVLVFAVLIAGGCWVWLTEAPPTIERLQPFFSHGVGGLARAMGYTFIALQGFDLIAAVAGEVRDPRRTLPRAMLASLAIALAVYLPLLLIIPVVGVADGSNLDSLIAGNLDTLVATAAERYLGPTGFWLVMAAGLLSMLSALTANLFAASRIARAMAQDRTLPQRLERLATSGSPVYALWCTAAITVTIIILVGDVGSAGAAASLIFLISFAMVHGICILARLRRPDHQGFRTPLWPWLPLLGLLSCAALAVFQGLSVPGAGIVAGVWLIIGSFAYVWIFARRARILDAAAEAADPDLLELRGRSPLVLLPIANPANAVSLAQMAVCLSPPRVGRILLLNVIRPPSDAGHGLDQRLGDVLEPSLAACLNAGVRVEAMATVATDAWSEIERVARVHRCASVLLGMHRIDIPLLRQQIADLARRINGNCVLLQAPPNWQIQSIRRILIPVGGRGSNHSLRARVLAGLKRWTHNEAEIRYLMVLPSATSEAERIRTERMLPYLVADEAADHGGQTELLISDDPGASIIAAAHEADLLILGLNQDDDRRPVFGQVVLDAVAAAPCPVMLIGKGR